MKITLLLLQCLLLALGVHAQHAVDQFNALHKKETRNLHQQILSYYWGGQQIQKNWVESDSTNICYNSRGLVDTLFVKSSEVWSFRKIYYTYDQNNRQVESILLELDYFGTGKWALSEKHTTKYDQIGNEIESASYNYGSNGWYMSTGSQSIYTYNPMNLLSMVETLSYDGNVSKYLKKYITTYEYDSGGVLITTTMKKWNETKNDYTNYYKTAEIIWHKWNKDNHSASLMASANQYLWYNNSFFNLDSRVSNVYDEHDNIIENKVEKTMPNTNWHIDHAFKYLLTYNTESALTEKIEQSWRGFDSSWENKSRYVYSNFTVYNSVKGAHKLSVELTVSPNPFSGQTSISMTENIENAQFVLYDITGKNVRNIDLVTGNTVLEKGDLPSGVYFYIVRDREETIAKGKILIE